MKLPLHPNTEKVIKEEADKDGRTVQGWAVRAFAWYRKIRFYQRQGYKVYVIKRSEVRRIYEP